MGHAVWMYRKTEGETEARLFDSDSIPEGWHDSPLAAAAVKEAPRSEPKRRGRPRKVL